MRLRDLLDNPDLRLIPLTGEEELDRPVRGVVATDLLDPTRYLEGGEFVLTGLMWHQRPEDSETFVAGLAARKVSGIAAGDAAFGSVPVDLVDACRRHGMPLFEVPVAVPFAAITEYVMRRLLAERGDAGPVVSPSRRLVATAARHTGLAGAFDLAARELGFSAWVLSPTGRLLVGATPSISAELRARLTRAFLAADELPCAVRTANAPAFSLFAVDPRSTHRAAGWFLAGEGNHEEWPDAARDLVEELLALVALERARVEERRRVERRLADELIQVLTSPTAARSEIAARIRSAGMSPEGRFAVVVAQVTGRSREVARAVLEEVVAGAVPAAAVAALPDEAVALVPVGPAPGGDAVGEISAAVAALEPAFRRDRLLIGVSEETPGAASLGGAVEEARHALRLAALRPGRACVVTAEEIDSHVLLLASVPDDVRRSFRRKVLGKLQTYDAEHHAELVRTLEAYLRHSGSWNRCARELHVHVNTLRYRIRRIQELTGRDLGSLADRVDFFLALRSG